MIELLGLTLPMVVAELAARGVTDPEIVRITGWRQAATGEERVIRIREGGRELTVARFPVHVEAEPPEGLPLS